jgi:hypothetical protein
VTYPSRGDFGLTPGTGWAMWVIRYGTGLPIGHDPFHRRAAKYGHACICIGPGPDAGHVMIVEAEPKAVRKRLARVDSFDWSTGGPLDRQLTEPVRDVIVHTALGCVGKGYDWPSIAAFLPRWFYSKWKGFDQDHPDHSLFCSELVVWCWRVAGVRGLLDSRAPGSIAPNDLAPFLPK